VNRGLKQIAFHAHGLAARNSWIARSYLRLFRVAKYLPDASWKNYLLNSLQSVQWPDVGLQPARVTVGPVNVSIVPHMEEFDFAAHIFRRMKYEPEVVSWLSDRQYDVVIEIGANVGIYTVLLSKLWPSARIYCFEPSRKAYRRLQENLALNLCANVCPFNCAVALHTGFVDFHEPDGHLTNGSLDQSFASLFSNEVRSTRVAAISGLEIGRLLTAGTRVLLKIDVEGAEPLVIRSLESLIAALHPDILIEVLPQTADALNEQTVFSSYCLYQLDPVGPRERGTFVAGQSRDYALLPKVAEEPVVPGKAVQAMSRSGLS
jgi:FkbM family methyltransferase